jgi:hypothetical protein
VFVERHRTLPGKRRPANIDLRDKMLSLRQATDAAAAIVKTKFLV